MRKQRSILIFTAVLVLQVFAAGQRAVRPAPSYATDGSLELPADYRTWVYLSSGLGMTYDAHATSTANPMFTNVFVKPEAFTFDTKDGLPLGPGSPVKTNACLDCHTKNGAVDHTFVQFYPTLKRVAIEKGTYNQPKE